MAKILILLSSVKAGNVLAEILKPHYDVKVEKASPVSRPFPAQGGLDIIIHDNEPFERNPTGHTTMGSILYNLEAERRGKVIYMAVPHALFLPPNENGYLLNQPITPSGSATLNTHDVGAMLIHAIDRLLAERSETLRTQLASILAV